MQTFWDWAGKLDVIFSLFTVVISVLLWIKVKHQDKQIKKLVVQLPPSRQFDQMREVLKGVKTAHPVALCMSLIPNKASIRQSVEDYLKKEGLEMKEFVEVNRDGISPDHIDEFMDEIRTNLRGKLNDATEIHLFIQGPVMAAAIVGGMLTNWGPVKLYHFNTPVGYEYWGPLVKF